MLAGWPACVHAAVDADPSMVRPLIDWAAGSAESRDRRLDL
jgi:hypothetical protein